MARAREMTPEERASTYPRWWTRFIAALQDGATQKQACERAKVRRETMWDWRRAFPHLQAEMVQAMDEGAWDYWYEIRARQREAVEVASEVIRRFKAELETSDMHRSPGKMRAFHTAAQVLEMDEKAHSRRMDRSDRQVANAMAETNVTMINNQLPPVVNIYTDDDVAQMQAELEAANGQLPPPVD